MHEKYTTRGVVIAGSPYKEADKIISIYTEDFGLVSAAAAGVRRSHSKLRYHTQELSLRQFSLVRGRDIWRLVGAEEVSERNVIRSVENLAVYARVISVIRRLVRGEEKNERVFATLYNFHCLLADVEKEKETGEKKDVFGNMKDRTSIDVPALEVLVVFRLLHALGYIKSDKATEPLINTKEIDLAVLELAKPLISGLISSINTGLAESHL